MVFFFVNVFTAFARKFGFGDVFTMDVTSPLVLLSIPVFILSAAGKLKPRKVFILLSAFMFVLAGHAIILYRLVFSKVIAESPQPLEGQAAISYLKHEIWWYELVSKIPTYSMLLIFLLAVYLYIREKNAQRDA
jgi:hypothetical protein